MWPFVLMYGIEVWDLAVSIGLFAGIIISINLLSNRLREMNILSIRDATKNHSWKSIQGLPNSYMCSICESLLVTMEGFYCDSCGVCADSGCIKKANGKLKCKEISVEFEGSMKHRWVKGNLPLGHMCDVCDEECNLDPGLVDLQCIWCRRCVHTACHPSAADVCDFGRFKNLIVPPNHIELTLKRARVGRKLRLKKINDPGFSNWTPLFVLGNCKSGNNKGSEILSGFRSVLNPAQVIDLCETPPSVLQEWLKLLPESAKPRVLVAGGDGTVAWVLTTLNHFNLKEEPCVAVVPLGTGNDLSRVLGWGKEEPKPFLPSDILDAVQEAKVMSLDRWRVNISRVKHLGLRRSAKTYFMYNYLSVGVDAQVTLDFHRTRQSPFYIFSSRIVNKLLYLTFGTQQVMERGCRNLEKRVELYLDGILIDLPSIESIVLLNIPSWGAGVPLWTVGMDDNEDVSFSDGLLNVVAIYSAFHIAQLQVGLSQPHRVGQAKSIKIKVKDMVPMQIDGEPWIESACEIDITHENQAKVMMRPAAHT